MRTRWSASLLLCTAAFAQQAGVAPEWDIGRTLKAISAHVAKLLPVIEQIHPQEWVAKGAPDTYVVQWNSSVAQAKSIDAAAQNLAQQPDRLPDALQILFRIESLDATLRSLEEGMRKYQNPAMAELLSGIAAENGANRERLQQYVLDLANERDQQFQVADREAQRCRESIAKEPAPVRKHK
jgi:hypothetical protein